jgi:hypothetical protein
MYIDERALSGPQDAANECFEAGIVASVRRPW